MNVNRRCVDLPRLDRSSADLSRHRYFFCEKTSGGAHFHVVAGKNGRFPSDEAVSLLAMHCMVRGLSPRDYAVFVPLEARELKGLYEKTAKLLRAGKSLHGKIRLTRREQEVLNALTSSLTNKEIAVALHLSERTVKFHVSSLLAKFSVRNRLDLAVEAWRCVPAVSSALSPVALQMARPFPENGSRHSKGPRPGDSLPQLNREIMA